MSVARPTGAAGARAASEPARDGGRPELDGLSQHVAAVAAARERLGRDLDQLTTEVRAQMGQTIEKTTWKLAATGGALLAAYLVRKLLMAGWRAATKGDPPSNPMAPQTELREALAWTVASGVGVGLARLLAQRGAAAGWAKATGKLPPGLQDVTP